MKQSRQSFIDLDGSDLFVRSFFVFVGLKVVPARMITHPLMGSAQSTPHAAFILLALVVHCYSRLEPPHFWDGSVTPLHMAEEAVGWRRRESNPSPETLRIRRLRA